MIAILTIFFCMLYIIPLYLLCLCVAGGFYLLFPCTPSPPQPVRILQRRHPWLTEVKRLAQGHTPGWWQGRDLKPWLSNPRPQAAVSWGRLLGFWGPGLSCWQSTSDKTCSDPSESLRIFFLKIALGSSPQTIELIISRTVVLNQGRFGLPPPQGTSSYV